MKIKKVSFALLCLFQITMALHSSSLSTSHNLRDAQQQHLESTPPQPQDLEILQTIRKISLDSNQKSSILSYLDKTKKQIISLQKVSEALSSEPQFQKIPSYFTNQEKFIQKIEKAITASSQSFTHYQATFQSNIFAKGWILGKFKIQDLLKKYGGDGAASKLANKCPQETPFFDGQKCIKCQKNLPVFNMFTLKCQKCPVDTEINDDKHICEQIPHYADYQKLENYALEGAPSLPVPDAKATPCLLNQPYFNGKCVQCKLPKYWSVKEAKCKECPKGKQFDLKTKTCKIPLVTNLDYLAVSSLYIQVGNFTLQNLSNAQNKLPQPTVNCPKQTPVWNGKECVGCPQGHHYFLSNFTCYKPKKASNFKAIAEAKNYLEIDGFTLSKMEANIKQKKLPVSKCPAHSPLFDGRTCIRCSQGLYYNLKPQKCVSITAVQPKVTFTTNTEAIKQQKNYLEIETATLENIHSAASKIPEPKLQCPKETPFFDGKACISCKSKLYNFKTLKCEECPEGTYFYQKSHTCKNIYLPNLSGNKWVVNSQKGLDNVYKLVRQRAALKRPIFCPDEKPHYNSNTWDCESCKSQYFWNYDTLSCVKCPQKYGLSIKTHRCELQDPSYPQLQEFSD